MRTFFSEISIFQKRKTEKIRKETTMMRSTLLLLFILTLSTSFSSIPVLGEEVDEGSSMRRFVFRLREGVEPEAFGAANGLRLVGQVGALRRYYEYEATERTEGRVVLRGSEWSDADPLEGSEWGAEQIPRVRVKRVIEAPRDYSEPHDPLYGSQVNKPIN